ncbi:hypothetical protein LGK95_21040 [Clostridium algoriphilum]|uniref:hypothetical protein n=1 Tax=Clostridium algoriphilum TaxID=198347 RepID=UPI001CF5B49A|nr:hypothetical protein [Clostridium algoriphilum]MCB2295949.1 hypothetical protein [Clostridium algoriphilum]
MSDKFGSILSELQVKVEATYKRNTELINKETADSVQKCQELQESSNKRFESYYNRKKLIDWLIYINLGLTPIFLILLFFIK